MLLLTISAMDMQPCILRWNIASKALVGLEPWISGTLIDRLWSQGQKSLVKINGTSGQATIYPFLQWTITHAFCYMLERNKIIYKYDLKKGQVQYHDNIMITKLVKQQMLTHLPRDETPKKNLCSMHFYVHFASTGVFPPFFSLPLQLSLHVLILWILKLSSNTVHQNEKKSCIF